MSLFASVLTSFHPDLSLFYDLGNDGRLKTVSPMVGLSCQDLDDAKAIVEFNYFDLKNG